MLSFATLPKIHLTKEDYVYDILRGAIMRCEIRPGEKLIIDSLAEQLGVSQNPIRGALRRLQADRLVEIVPHTGAVVADISPDTITEIFMLLESLGRSAFEVAVGKASDAQINKLRRLVDAMDAELAAGNSDRWSDLNSQLHLEVARITQMEMLVEFTQRTLDSWDRLRRCYLEPLQSTGMAQAQAEHRQMIELLAQQDVPGLVSLIEQHNRRAKESYQQILERRPELREQR